MSALTEQSAALWRRIQAGRAPSEFGRLLRKLDWAHQRLARVDAELPATPTVRRHRRHCLEVLQSENANVEALLARLAASTAELKALAEHQLELSREVIQAAPPVLKAWSWRDGPRLVEVILVLALLGFVAISKWPWLFFAAVIFLIILGQKSRPRARLELQFDGRSLRVVRRLFGIPCRATSVDLTRFNEVVVTDSGRLAVSSPGGKVELDTQPIGRELELQVRDWCACAAREQC